MNTIAQSDRLSYIDVLKGLGMFIVVYGHISHINNPDCRYIWGFHMPLFFFISGFLYRPQYYVNFATFIKSRYKKLLIPYLIFYLCILLYWYFVESKIFGRGDGNFWKEFFLMFYGNYTVSGVTLWFLPCLFTIEVLYFFVEKAKIWQLLLSFVLCALGVILIRIGIDNLPLGVSSALLVFPFYSIGHVFKEIFAKQYSLLVYNVTMIICFLFQIQMLPYSSIEISTFYIENEYLYIPVAFAGIFLFLSLSKSINHCKCLEWMGRNSIVIFAFHPIIYRIIIYVVSIIMSIQMDEVRNGRLYCILITILTIIALIPFVKAWKNVSARLGL